MPKRARRADRAPTDAVKRRIWDPRVRALDVDDRRSSDTPTGVRVRGVRERADVGDARRAAARELALFRSVKRARRALQRIARARTGRTDEGGTPLLLFERWLARCAVSGALAAPVLPAQGLGLANDLIRHGASERDGAEGAAEALAVAKESAARWAEARDDGGEARDAVVVRDKGAFLTMQLGTEKPYVKCAKAHLGKLRALYCRTVRGCEPLTEDVDSDEYQKFACAVFALLMRYESLGGAGYQSALAEDAFDVLNEKLGVSCECFASPLNARYGQFCSQFGFDEDRAPDVDAFFGSLGSFFSDDFAPKRGSFEMNPPFVPETMSRAVEKANDLLDRAANANEALSFVVIVPLWKECHYWSALLESRHLQHGPDIIDAQSHGFCDGAQHARPSHERHRVSSFDTGVFYLRTSRAECERPVDEEIRKRVLRGMKTALGSCKDVQELEVRYRGERARGGPAKIEDRK